MKSLLSVTQASPASLKEIARNLDRVATALEALLYHGYDIASPTAKVDTSGVEPEALYSDDEKSWTQEYLASQGMESDQVERLTAKMDEDDT